MRIKDEMQVYRGETYMKMNTILFMLVSLKHDTSFYCGKCINKTKAAVKIRNRFNLDNHQKPANTRQFFLSSMKILTTAHS